MKHTNFVLKSPSVACRFTTILRYSDSLVIVQTLENCGKWLVLTQILNYLYSIGFRRNRKAQNRKFLTFSILKNFVSIFTSQFEELRFTVKNSRFLNINQSYNTQWYNWFEIAALPNPQLLNSGHRLQIALTAEQARHEWPCTDMTRALPYAVVLPAEFEKPA